MATAYQCGLAPTNGGGTKSRSPSAVHALPGIRSCMDLDVKAFSMLSASARPRHSCMPKQRSGTARPMHCATARAAAQAAVLATADSEEHPAVQTTLATLGWPALCEFVAKFASTTLGRQAVQRLTLPQEQAEVEALVKETAAVDKLETEYAVELDFGGTSTSQASGALKRASRGGMLVGAQLQAVASTLVGAARLQRSVMGASNAADGTGDYDLFSALAERIRNLQSHSQVVKNISACVSEEGDIRDSASDEVRQSRGKLRAVENRLKAILKGHSGEVSEMSGRLCVVLPASQQGPPKGILLGTSPGGGAFYIEPPSAVPLNNELAAARGEAAAAEEKVMWQLTGQVIDNLADMQAALAIVIWLDVATARARYGRWIGGTLPTFVPVPLAGKASAKARKGAKVTERQSAGADGEEEEYSIRLKQLRHPLLLGRHLQEKERNRQQMRRGQHGAQLRRLSNRKQSTQLQSQNGTEMRKENQEDAAVLASGPVAIDVCVRPETRAVIITGPNTGGKTATLKAFGLAILMARAGLAVPAEAPVQVPAYSAVLADIGDEQSLSANLSTFSGHLRRIQAVRAASDSRSLVLLDEVGTGTEPVEGSALGVALLETLVKGGRGGAGFTMATTHHSSLTSLKFENPAFENASVEFDEQKLAPTYRLLWGVPGRSNALNIAAGLGLDASLVQAARDALGTGQAAVDSTIMELEGLKRTVTADNGAVQQLQRQMATLRRKLVISRQDVAQSQASLQLRKAEAITKAVLATRQQLIPIIEQQEKEAAARKQEAQKAQEVEQHKKLVSQGWRPAVGSTVYVPRLNASLKVVKAPSSPAEDAVLVVQKGFMQVSVSMNEIQKRIAK